MKFKLDENFPHPVMVILRGWDHDVHSVQDEGLEGSQDTALWSVVQAEGRVLLTVDLDFTDRRTYSPQSMSGIVVFRLRSPDGFSLIRRVQAVRAELEGAAGKLLIVSDTKVRVSQRR